MKTWKKIVIASSVTIITGLAVYYIIQIRRIKKIKDRGFTINVSTEQANRGAVPTFPEDSSGNQYNGVPAVGSEFGNFFIKLIGLQ